MTALAIVAKTSPDSDFFHLLNDWVPVIATAADTVSPKPDKGNRFRDNTFLRHWSLDI